MFEDIARRFFSESLKDVGADVRMYEEWIRQIAEAYRTAMAQLDVKVAPKGPKPDYARTLNGTLMMLIGALENGDIWVRDTLVPVRKHETTGVLSPAGNLITFDCGELSVEAAFAYDVGRRTMEFQRIVALQLGTGQRMTSDHPNRRWLAVYRPSVALDVFSPSLQAALSTGEGLREWRVIGKDEYGRTWHWPNGRDPQVWKDARGREL